MSDHHDEGRKLFAGTFCAELNGSAQAAGNV
jgi:hypothetical protein